MPLKICSFLILTHLLHCTYNLVLICRKLIASGDICMYTNWPCATFLSAIIAHVHIYSWLKMNIYNYIWAECAKQFESWLQGRISHLAEAVSPGFLDLQNSKILEKGTTRNIFEWTCGLVGCGFQVCFWMREPSLQQKYHIFFWWVSFTLICEEFDSKYKAINRLSIQIWNFDHILFDEFAGF